MENVTMEIENLSVGYRVKGGNKVVARVRDVELNRGELVCLLGKDGVGKSSLLRTLSAKQPALAGGVKVLDVSLKRYGSKHLSRIMSTVMADEDGKCGKTVWNFVAMGRSPHTGMLGRLKESDKTVVEKCLNWFGIEHLASRKMSSLSDGERKKVVIAKAIAQETPFVILDEPTDCLDYPNKLAMMQLLHRLAKALNKTIILATNDLMHALQVADKVWLLDPEKGLTIGVPEDLCLDGSIERYFETEGQAFNRDTATFTVQFTTARDVAVSGNTDSLEYRLFCKAMMRNGMRPVEAKGEHAADKVKLLVPGDGTYRLIEQGKETLKVEKIGHLIGVIVPAITRHHILDIRESAGMNEYE